MDKPWILKSITKKDIEVLFASVDESWQPEHVKVSTAQLKNDALAFWLLYQDEVLINHISFYGKKSEKTVAATSQKIFSRFVNYFTDEVLAKTLQTLLLNLLQNNEPYTSKHEHRLTINNALKTARASGLMWNSSSAAKLVFENFDIQIVIGKADYLKLKSRLLNFIDDLNENWEDKVIVDGQDILLDRRLGLKRFNQNRPRLLYGELYRSVYAHSIDFTRPYQAKVLECLFANLEKGIYHEMGLIAAAIDDKVKTVKNSVSEINNLTQECIQADAILYTHKGVGTDDNKLCLNPDLECVRVACERARRRQEVKSKIK